jgi:NAD(P)-dependent dehydrogenase (short-subunit alcohol dehydrogenase family)
MQGKVIVVTGGASGIGAGTARRFVQEGARVVVADLQVDAGERLASELGDVARFVEPTSRAKTTSRPPSTLRWRRSGASTACSTMPASWEPSAP